MHILKYNFEMLIWILKLNIANQEKYFKLSKLIKICVLFYT